jgi:hypothetical protein
MRNLRYTFLIIATVGNISMLGLPWWLVVVISAFVAYIFPTKVVPGATVAFLAGFLLWFVYAYSLDNANASMLSAKVGIIFKGLTSMHLLLITGFLGGLLAKLGYLTGHYAQQLFVSPKQNVVK